MLIVHFQEQDKCTFFEGGQREFKILLFNISQSKTQFLIFAIILSCHMQMNIKWSVTTLWQLQCHKIRPVSFLVWMVDFSSNTSIRRLLSNITSYIIFIHLHILLNTPIFNFFSSTLFATDPCFFIMACWFCVAGFLLL